jgi:hypothetical protein
MEAVFISDQSCRRGMHLSYMNVVAVFVIHKKPLVPERLPKVDHAP